MRRTALQTFFRRALLAALPLSLYVPAQATSPSCGGVLTVPAIVDDDGGTTNVIDADGGVSSLDCNRVCNGVGYWCDAAQPSPSGTPMVNCHYNRCGTGCGRLTDGMTATVVHEGCDCSADDEAGVVARYFESAARLEAVSVLAFRRLARELAVHGAPDELVARAQQSAREEVRHARIVGRLAVAHGGRRAPLPRASLSVRAFEDVVIENAVEGCVRETYGALVASWQGLTAAAPRVRGALRAVAADEERHAELAWSIARWGERRLGATACRRLRARQREAIAALAREVDVEPPAPLVRVAGLPSAVVARSLLEDARRTLWMRAA